MLKHNWLNQWLDTDREKTKSCYNFHFIFRFDTYLNNNKMKWNKNLNLKHKRNNENMRVIEKRFHQTHLQMLNISLYSELMILAITIIIIIIIVRWPWFDIVSFFASNDKQTTKIFGISDPKWSNFWLLLLLIIIK